MSHILKTILAFSILTNISLAQNFSELPITQITKKSKFKFDKQIVLKAGEKEKVFCSPRNIRVRSSILSRYVNCTVSGSYHSTKEYEHATAIPENVEVLSSRSETSQNDEQITERKLTYKIGDHEQVEYKFSCGGFLEANPDLINTISVNKLGSECDVEITPYVQVLDLDQPANTVGENLQPCAQVSDRSRSADQEPASSDTGSNTVSDSSQR